MIILAKKLYHMMTFETTMILANLATKLTLTPGEFNINTPMMMKVTA